MAGRFLTQRQMNIARQDERVMNSIIKRRKINGYAVLNAWGCGCCFGYIKEYAQSTEGTGKTQ